MHLKRKKRFYKMITFEMHLNAYWYICAALLIFVAY